MHGATIKKVSNSFFTFYNCRCTAGCYCYYYGLLLWFFKQHVI